MKYFDDILFLDGSVIDGCQAQIDRSFPGSYSLEFMRAGRMNYGVDGEACVELTQPCLFWHLPGRRYCYGAVDERGWDHHWVTFRGARARRLMEDGFHALCDQDRLAVVDVDGMAESFRRLIGSVQRRDVVHHALAVAELERILALAHGEGVGLEGQRQGAKRLSALRDRIVASVGDVYDFEAEARWMGMSYSHFRRRFRELTGSSPHQFLIRSRMQQACRLLRDLDRPVKAIGFECGYEEPSDFSRMFKRVVGVSPREYRESLPAFASGTVTR